MEGGEKKEEEEDDGDGRGNHGIAMSVALLYSENRLVPSQRGN